MFLIEECTSRSLLVNFLWVILFTLKRVSSENSLKSAQVVLPVPLLPITITFPLVSITYFSCLLIIFIKSLGALTAVCIFVWKLSKNLDNFRSIWKMLASQEQAAVYFILVLLVSFALGFIFPRCNRAWCCWLLAQLCELNPNQPFQLPRVVSQTFGPPTSNSRPSYVRFPSSWFQYKFDL